MSETCQQSHAVPDDAALKQQLKSIDQTLIVLSGKGGVGKSTLAVNLALSLASKGLRTGLLDVDIHGPSVPKLLNITSRRLGMSEGKIVPMECYLHLRVMSMGFLLDQDDQPVIWRGPLKYNVIKEFLQNVAWGELDYLVVDCPPGTGDEPLSIAQMLKGKASAVIVTTPQQVATVDVAKCITFCNQLELPIAGIVENMSGFVCPHCGKEVDIFSQGGGEKLAAHYGVPFLGKIPLDPEIVKSGDEGQPYVYFYARTKTAERFAELVETIVSHNTSKNLLKEEIS
jgi:ATP-binding protein involved in chromosome partitioning